MTATTIPDQGSLPRRLTDRVIAKLVLGLNRRIYERLGEDRPAFHDQAATYPRLQILNANADVIRAEMERLLPARDQIPRYHDISDREQYISGTVDPDRSWRVFMLKSLVGKVQANQVRCPQTSALIDQIPNVFQAFFSILDPGKSIPAHCGEFYGYLRYHLALRVPTQNPPSMRVKDRIHTWVDGESIVFDDSCEHEVYNKSPEIRVVLIVDLLRPLPLHLHVLNWLVTRLFMRHGTEAKVFLNKLKKYS
jgi:aspartate beta-hydroxylase/beta-hydroxylase